MEDLAGQSIGRYHIIEPLGQGGMAVVYKAFDTRLERDVAIKVIRTDAIPANLHSQMLKRFEREAKALAKLQHPNIVGVHDYGEHDGAPFLVMDYVTGGTLKARCCGAPMPYAEAARLLQPVADALAYAHSEGVVHRDVKPANILISKRGVPMLSDFGIAKLLDTEVTHGLTGSGVGIGTPEYMAPEQWQGKAVPQTDIYALGVVFYELVTGKKPYTADTPAAVLIKQISEPLPRPRDFVPDLPEEVERVLFKALAKDAGERYASMGEFSEKLAEIISLPVESEKDRLDEKQQRALEEKNRSDYEERMRQEQVRREAEAETATVKEKKGEEEEARRHKEAERKRRQKVGAYGIGILLLVGGVVFGGLALIRPPDRKSGVENNPNLMPTAVAVTPLTEIQNGQTQLITPTFTPFSSVTTSAVGGCIPGSLEWTFPKPNEEISGNIELKGIVNFPDLGFYKYEYSKVSSENWFTIAAGNQIKKDEPLGGTWNTEQLVPGNYLLRLVVAKNTNEMMPACIIPIKITAYTPQPDPSIVTTQVSEKDGMTLVYVPAGEFKMGSEDGNPDEKPVHTVYLDAYWIDQTEVTNGMFEKFVQDTGYETDAEKHGSGWVINELSKWSNTKGADWRHPRGPGSNISNKGHHPVTLVGWNDANVYCNWAGRRLPTEAEWEKAARNMDGRTYPWGNTNPGSDKLNYNMEVKDTTTVGSYPDGVSPYGALDMAGNVGEWVADWYDSGYYETSPSKNPIGPDKGRDHVMRGGAWNDGPSNSAQGSVRSTNRRGDVADDDVTWSSGYGFRCAASLSDS